MPCSCTVNYISICLHALLLIHCAEDSNNSYLVVWVAGSLKPCDFLDTRGPLSDWFRDKRLIYKALYKLICLLFSERELTFTLAICYRPPVCRLSVCLSSVTFVHPTQAITIFGNVSTSFNTLAILWHPGKILRRPSQGNPFVGGVKHKRGRWI